MMKLLLTSVFMVALPLAWLFAEANLASEHPAGTRQECRKKADEMLASELKECKLKAKDYQKSCSMAALKNNNEVISRCGTAQVPVPPT